MANLANCKISLQDAMGLSRGFAINETDNPVFESNCPVKFPTIDRKSMQAVRTVACCQRKNVDDDFVNEVVDGKPV